MESRKKVLMSLFIGSSGDANIEKRLVDTVGEGEGGTNWKSNIETYILPHVKQPRGIGCGIQGAET